MNLTTPRAIIIVGVLIAIALAAFPRYTSIPTSFGHIEHDRWTGKDRACQDTIALSEAYGVNGGGDPCRPM